MKSLSILLDQYLCARRSLGYTLQEPGYCLRNFVVLAGKEGAEHITTELALRCAMQSSRAQPATWTARLGMVCRFAEWCSLSEPGHEVPPLGLLTAQYHRQRPYIYRDQEIPLILAAARKLGSSKGLRATTYATLFGLLAATGMRVSEALTLDGGDVDLDAGLLAIRCSKFGRARFVPIHPSSSDALAAYAEHRDRCVPVRFTKGFFVLEEGIRISGCAARYTFALVSRQIGLRKSAGGSRHGHGPRLHDMVAGHRTAREPEHTPLRHEVATVLDVWVREQAQPPDHPLFPTVHGGALSSDAVQRLVAKRAAEARQHCPTLDRKHVTPHVLRHTAAMELLQHGVDCSVIALWLGHESIELGQHRWWVTSFRAQRRYRTRAAGRSALVRNLVSICSVTLARSPPSTSSPQVASPARRKLHMTSRRFNGSTSPKSAGERR